MHVPLQVTILGIDNAEVLVTRIRDKVRGFDEFDDFILSCRVVVEIPHKNHPQIKKFAIRIDIGVTDNEIVVNRDHAQVVYVAMRDAFEAATCQLKDYAGKHGRFVTSQRAIYPPHIHVQH